MYILIPIAYVSFLLFGFCYLAWQLDRESLYNGQPSEFHWSDSINRLTKATDKLIEIY